MGKSLDAALPDFTRRFGREARLQKQLFRDSHGNRRPKRYLYRNLVSGKRKRRLEKHVYFAIDIERDSSIQPGTKITAMAIIVTDGTRTAILERISLNNLFQEVSFFDTKEPYLTKLRESGLEVQFQVTINGKLAEQTSKKARLSSNSVSRLAEGDEAEWSYRSMPKHDATALICTFDIVKVSELQVFQIRSESNKQIMWTLKLHRREKQAVESHLSREESLGNQESSLAAAIRLENLSALASDTEFRFPFGPALALRRSQRAHYRCIFCGDLVGPPKRMLTHLAFDHRFRTVDLDCNVAQGLLLITVQSTSKKTENDTVSLFPRSRAYVHSKTCEPLLPFEVDDDSEDDVDESWIHERSELLVDEFVDIQENERELIKLWNRHIRFHSKTEPILDKSMPAIAELFVKENKRLLGPLRRELILHLLNLWDHGLMTKDSVKNCIRWLD